MKNRDSRIIRTYFSDYVNWLIVVSVLFIVSFVAAVAFNGVNRFIWLIPVLFLIIYFLSTPLLILFCKASKDLRADNIKKLTIKISAIRHDDSLTFKNRGGATVGMQKYRIVDENNNIYLLSTSNDKDNFMILHPHPTFCLEIEVLKKSRLVLSMKIIENPKTIKESHKQQDNIKHFKKAFSHYFDSQSNSNMTN